MYTKLHCVKSKVQILYHILLPVVDLVVGLKIPINLWFTFTAVVLGICIESFATITWLKQQNRKWLNTFLQLPTYAANVRSRFTLQQITNNIDNIKSDNNNSNLHLENYTSYVCKYSVKFSPDIKS